MNPYLKQVNKIEFVVTNQCTGHCKHCSQGERSPICIKIDPRLAAEAVHKIAKVYDIQTAMTFGGEPLLHPEAVYALRAAARDSQIPRRQVITNGYFSRDIKQIRAVARQLAACGVNDLLLSVDCFHQETIPLDVVKRFAEEAKHCGIPIRLQPAWLISSTAKNPYNLKTREILNCFFDMGIAENEGNVVFPEGNARIYLANYFKEEIPINPYVEDPHDVRCISFSPNGDVLGGNVYEQDVMTITENYAPHKSN